MQRRKGVNRVPDLTITVTVPVLARIKAAYGWSALSDAAAGEAARTFIRETFKLGVRNYEQNIASDAARAAVTDIVVT